MARESKLGEQKYMFRGKIWEDMVKNGKIW
jgi:hypothetical protein